MELYLLKWEHSGKRLQSKRHRIFFIQIKDRALKVRCKTLPNSSLSLLILQRVQRRGCSLVVTWRKSAGLTLFVEVWRTNGASHWVRRDESYKGKDLGKPSRSKVTKEWHPWKLINANCRFQPPLIFPPGLCQL